MKITEKDVGRRFETRDGRIFTITRVGGSERYPVVAQEGDGVEDKGGEAVRLTADGGYYAKDAECYERTPNDFAEWVTEQDDKMDEQDRYELRMTVVDVKGSATTYKKYLPFLASLCSIIDKKTCGIVSAKSDDKFWHLMYYQLKSKGNVVKITRQVNALGANLATLIIRVTRLRD